MMEDLPTIPEWVNRAVCATVDPEIWFPNKGDYQAVNKAKKICRTCPVRRQCRELAIEDPKLDGVWGGMTVMERRAERMKRGKAA